MLEIIQTAYSRFYQTTKSSDLVRALDLWAEIFKDDNVVLVASAIRNLIRRLEFPPTIADVRKEMESLIETASDEPSAIEEYNAIRQAIKSSIYYSVENFEKLPKIAQEFVGSPMQLREWAMSEDFNEEVLRGQFLKQYESLKERKKYKQMLANDSQLNDLIQSTIKKQQQALTGEREADSNATN